MAIHLNRLYTRAGDDGLTMLGNMQRVPKTHQRVIALGAVDELNASIGVAIAALATADTASSVASAADNPAALLAGLQNTLFDLGADLSVPHNEEQRLRVTAEQVAELESRIDSATARLEPLRSFILPGGSPAAAALHFARTVCRRAEIEVLRLVEHDPVNPEARKYLNRLSDLLFAAARLANDGGRGDVLWSPGG